MDSDPTDRARANTTRARVAREAARLMYREGVSQYFDAKRIAAKRILGREARGAQFRAGDLPSNGEIRDALLEMVALAEGEGHRERRLFVMRIEALRLMRDLEPWQPRLIGSVWSGYARYGSDIDLHVFVESVEQLERELSARGWIFTPEEVLIRDGNDFRTYHHLHVHETTLCLPSHTRVLECRFPVELSVYPLAERKRTTRSSTDGRTIDRVGPKRLAKRIEADHPRAWRDWCDAGGLDAHPEDVAALLELSDRAGEPGEFDGLLAELSALHADRSGPEQ